MSDPTESTQANPHPVSQHRSRVRLPRMNRANRTSPTCDIVAKEVSTQRREDTRLEGAYPRCRVEETAKAR